MKRIDLTLDVMLAKRRMKLKDLSEMIGVTKANLSIMKRNKSKAVRFSTIEKICDALDCEVHELIRLVEE